MYSAAFRRDLTELGLRLALRDGRPGRIFEWAERGRASRLRYRRVRPPDDPRLADLLAQLRDVALQRETPEGKAQAALVRRQVALERQIRDHTRLRRGEPDAASTAPVTPAAIGRALGDRALLEFVQLDGVLHGLSLVRGRLRTRALGPVEPIAELLQRLPFALHRLASPATAGPSRSAALALLRHTAARLDELLLRPWPELRDDPLVVVPTGPLHSLPWAILPSCGGRPVAVSPSATLWAAAGQHPSKGDGAVAVIAGPRLPGALAEAGQVAAVHGTQPVVGPAATVDAVLAALTTATVAHVAAHGRLHADNPLFSDLLLADGPLVVYDLERLATAPHTVVLAACDGGRSVVHAGDELLGLSSAFIALGAAQLVGSVIPVPDAETAPLMVLLHRRLAAGDPPASALAAAQHELRGDDPAALAAAAGFICLGSGFAAPPLGAGLSRERSRDWAGRL